VWEKSGYFTLKQKQTNKQTNDPSDFMIGEYHGQCMGKNIVLGYLGLGSKKNIYSKR